MSSYSVKRAFAPGGIPRKNPFPMQVTADVFGKEIGGCQIAQASTLGSAILGAAASGKQLARFIQRMAAPTDTVYRPVHAEAYEPLYQQQR